jgi:hypothetical protein
MFCAADKPPLSAKINVFAKATYLVAKGWNKFLRNFQIFPIFLLTVFDRPNTI